MTTRKTLIKNEFLRLCKKIDNILDKQNILPNIDNYDFCDIIYMFNIEETDAYISILQLALSTLE